MRCEAMASRVGLESLTHGIMIAKANTREDRLPRSY